MGERRRVIREQGIVLSVEEREAAIWAAAEEAARKVGGSIPSNARSDLLHEVAQLVEAPTPLLGSFDPSFLSLPK